MFCSIPCSNWRYSEASQRPKTMILQNGTLKVEISWVLDTMCRSIAIRSIANRSIANLKLLD